MMLIIKKSLIRKAIISALILLPISPVYAGAYCWNENIEQLVIRENGFISFLTDKSCPFWCTINPAWPENRIKNSYAMLLSAKLSGSPVTFYWQGQVVGCEEVPLETSPTTIMLNN